MTSAIGVRDPVLQRFVDAMLGVIRRENGTLIDPAPFTWKDELQQLIHTGDTSEYIIRFHIHPGGLTASVVVEPIGSMARSIQGPVDIQLLATKLV